MLVILNFRVFAAEIEIVLLPKYCANQYKSTL